MYLLGLTGGIASGKSTIASRLAEHGAVVVDADQVARDVVAPGTPGLAAVVDAFGAQVLRADGSLDRRALGAIVFSDPDRLASLNAIVHPRVRAETARLIAEQPVDAIVVYDVPLLVEANVDHPFDLIVVAQASPSVRIDRLVTRRGFSVEEAEKRVRAQASDAERNARADVIIHTDGSLEQTLSRADDLWRRATQDASNS